MAPRSTRAAIRKTDQWTYTSTPWTRMRRVRRASFSDAGIFRSRGRILTAHGNIDTSAFRFGEEIGEFFEAGPGGPARARGPAP